MDELLSQHTRFWVVRPRIAVSGASGIETLLSGSYIAMDPGKRGEFRDQFRGLEEPPKVLSDARGSLYRLRAASLGSLSIGSPVYHRDIEVGEVTGYHLVPEEGYILINVFINSPYDRLVHNNSRFWNVSGMDVEIGGDGVNVRMESLVSLLVGGVAFETPETLDARTKVLQNKVFPLYESYEQSKQQVIRLTVPYVLYFDESVRGLSVGAPVEFRGIRIGSVQEISIRKSEEGRRLRIAVLIGLEPERVPFADNSHVHELSEQHKHFDKLLQDLVAQGLRAQLVPGNLLTGQLIVDLGMLPDAVPARIDYSGVYPELPTTTGTINGITQRISSILDKLEQVPFDAIGQEVEGITRGLNEVVNNEATQKTVENLSEALEQMKELLAFVNRNSESVSRQIGELTEEARSMIVQAEHTFKTLETTTSSQGVLSTELERTLRAMAEAARSVSAMASYLERHPEALFKGKSR